MRVVTRWLTPDDGRWSASGTWVVEHCAEKPEEPEPLFRVDTEANAETVARIHNELLDEVRKLTGEKARASESLAQLCMASHTLLVEFSRLCGAWREIEADLRNQPTTGGH
jgi:hypothetical protein